MIDAINSAFVWVLNWIYSWMGNYGWSVVMFTLFIRIIVMPLDMKSRKSMRDMQRIQPKVAALQKKYANDQEKLNQKTMELYKKENVSMAGSCLPMLLQYPILIFMFTAMRVVANEHTITMILEIQKTGAMPAMQSWLWIKNVFQPDSFMSSILPAAGDALKQVSAVRYSSILTQENIEAAREFLSSAAYADFLNANGLVSTFRSIPLNFGFFAPTLRIPTSLAAMFSTGNGLFILPLFAACSQFLMTKVMSPTPKDENGKPIPADQLPANQMNQGFMKWFFPLFSLWICASYNAAFSIYWMAVNVISIIQNIGYNRYFDAKEKKAAKVAAEANEG